jgi:hypothetical protein
MAKQFRVNTLILSGQNVTGLYYPLTGNPSNFIIPSQTGAFYSSANPSGFITGVNLSTYITTGQTGQFASTVNLNSTGLLLQNEIVSLSGTNNSTFATISNLVLTGSNLFATITGLSGYSAATYVPKSATGIFVTTGQTGNFAANTGILTGAFYPLHNNPNQYVTLTGVEIITGLKYFNYINPNFISGDVQFVDENNILDMFPSSRILTDYNGNTSLDWNNLQLQNAGITIIDWGNYIFYDGNSSYNTSIDFGNRTLNDNFGQITVDWENKILQSAGQPVFNWQYGSLYDNNIVEGEQISIDSNNRGLYYRSGNFNAFLILDWQNQILSGFWKAQGLSISGYSVIIASQTGNFYSNNNPNGYITGLNTGNFITSFQTGIFITTGQTGSFGGITPTGILTGVFYPLNTNPSGYISGFNSGLYTLNSSTGAFITTGQTGNFGGTTNTGQLTGAFYPLTGSRPSINYTTNIDWSASNSFYTTLTGNTTYTFSNSKDGQNIIVSVRNTGTNGFTGSWPNTVKWSYQIIPTQTSGNFTDIYNFVNFTGVVFGSVIQGF